MQNSTTKTQAKRNQQFDLYGSTTLTDSIKFRPLKLIQKPTIDSTTQADSTHDVDLTHLWIPTTDSTSILELKPSQHTSKTQPIQTTFKTHTDSTHLWNPADPNHHFEPNKHRFNPTKNNRVKRKKNREKRRDREIER